MSSSENELEDAQGPLLLDEPISPMNLYKKLANVFPSPVFALDTSEQKISFANEYFFALLGYEQNDLLGFDNDIYKIIVNEDTESFKYNFQKCTDLTDEEYHMYESRLKSKTGDWKYFRTKGTVLNRHANGKAETLLFVAEDITTEMHHAEELQKSRQLIAETEKMHHFGMYNYDVLADRFTWSDGIYNLLEVKTDENPNPDCHFFKQFIVPEDRERMELMAKGLSKDTNEYEQVFSIQTQTGNIKILQHTTTLVRNEHKEIVRYMGSLKDVTKELLFERELQKNIRDLHNSNKELEEFAYVASHDLQEPLRKIITFSSRLQTKYNSLLGDEGNGYLDRMTVAANNMRILIENLLEISKTSRQDQPFSKVDLNVIIGETINELELNIEENKVSVNIIKALPEIEAVAPLMHQLFANLINNSIKFKSGKAPVIDISYSHINKDRREKLLLPEKSFYEITFTDNGIGFEQEYAERVFQIFQRLHGRAEYPGSGIGLSICKKIVEKHNGMIFAESAVNRGTTFYIILPEKQQ